MKDLKKMVYKVICKFVDFFSMKLTGIEKNVDNNYDNTATNIRKYLRYIQMASRILQVVVIMIEEA